MARYIFELIILMCSFYVKYLSIIYIPRNFTDSSLLYLPILLLIIVYFNTAFYFIVTIFRTKDTIFCLLNIQTQFVCTQPIVYIV